MRYLNKWPSLFLGTKSSNDVDRFIGKSTTCFKEIKIQERSKIFFKNSHHKNDLELFSMRRYARK